MADQVNPVRAVLDRLGPDGALWAQGALGDYRSSDQPVCIVGAFWSLQYYQGVIDVDTSTRGMIEMCRAIREQFPGREYIGLADFNDDYDVEWDDVRTVLEKAAVNYDEVGW